MRARHCCMVNGPGRGTRLGGIAVAAVLAMTLAGCHSPGADDYRDRYRIEAEMKTFRAEVPMPRVLPDGSGADIAMMPGFLEEYNRRARSAMRVQVPANPTPRDQQAAEMLLTWLADRGVETVVVPSVMADLPPTDGYVSLSYDAYVAVVPNCGDWSGETGFNPGNLPHSNFGCAYQRNIGLMLSDPGDLEQARPTGPPDAARQRLIVEQYRVGQPTGAALPRLEAGPLSDIAN